MAKVIGVSISNASPSTPANALPDRERTSNSMVENSCQLGLSFRWPIALKVTMAAASVPVEPVTAKTPRFPVSILRRWDTSTEAPRT